MHRRYLIVMAGLDPAIHAVPRIRAIAGHKDMDARTKSGHDGKKWGRLRSAASVCAALLLALAPFPAVAGDASLPPIDPPDGWHFLTEHDTAASSRCIGRPDTPLCAVETLLACFQRGRIELCRQVDDGADQYAQAFSEPLEQGKYLAYRVIAAQKAEGGDVLIRLEQRAGSVGQVAEQPTTPASDFLLHRQTDGTWKVVGWGDL